MTKLEDMQQVKVVLTFNRILRIALMVTLFVSTCGLVMNIYSQEQTIRIIHDIVHTRNIIFKDTSIQQFFVDKVKSMDLFRAVEMCPEYPPDLHGRVSLKNYSLPFEEIERMYPWVQPGGRYRPPECIARHRTAIVIPYRNRDPHLRTLLLNLHPFLRKQQLDYGIYVINQEEGSKFNRAMLMNIGFVEALKIYNYTCFMFHDVDLLPEDDRNIYGCFGNPRHVASAIHKHGYKMPYKKYFGGVTSLSRTEYEKMNGCSNLFFGWGGEDDDMLNRVLKYNMTVVRWPPVIARYTMINHTRDKGNEKNVKRMQQLKEGKQFFEIDGINNLQYKIKNLQFRKLFTWISVELNQTKIMEMRLQMQMRLATAFRPRNASHS